MERGNESRHDKSAEEELRHEIEKAKYPISIFQLTRRLRTELDEIKKSLAKDKNNSQNNSGAQVSST